MCQVYFLIDPRSLDVFYVGIGNAGRAEVHIATTKNKLRKGLPLHHGRHVIIADLLSAGLSPTIQIVHDHLSKDEAKRLEVEYIAKLGRIDLGTGKLTNRTRGGEWINDCPRTAEWLERMSISNLRAQNTAETKYLKSIALKGKKRTAEQCERIRQSQLAARGSASSRAVACTVDGVEYASMREARRELNITAAKLSQLLKQSHTTSLNQVRKSPGKSVGS